MLPPSSLFQRLSTATRSRGASFQGWLKAFAPAPMTVDARERMRAAAGALVGILFTAAFSRWMSGSAQASAWLLAPLGASAVLVFAAPASPLAQPWSVIGGNTVSALIGVACAAWLSDVPLAGAVAVGLAITVMFALRCLHPPGGAMALSGVLLHASHGHLAVDVALGNSLLLVLMGLAYNAATGRSYPHVPSAPREPAAGAGQRFHSEDLDKVLARYNQVLDISRDDLETLLHEAEMEGMRRRARETLCRDVMTRAVVTVEASTPLETAWETLRAHRIKALPVVDRSQRIVGIITRADFLRAMGVDEAGPFAVEAASQEGKDGKEPKARAYKGGARIVGQIMTRQVRVASEDRHAVKLLPLFTEGGHHHIPVIDADKRIVGIITQSDFVRALWRIEH